MASFVMQIFVRRHTRSAMRWPLLILALILAMGHAAPGEAARGPQSLPAAKKKPPKAVKATKKVSKAPRGQKRAEKPALPAADIGQRWRDVQQGVVPKALLLSCAAFAKDFPGSAYDSALKDIAAGAQRALAAQRAAQLSSDALVETSGDDDYRGQLGQAARGDKDAALRIARMYADGSHGLPRSSRRSEQWLRFAAELGNGDASWQLAETLNRAGLLADAGKYESRAVELGYPLPPRLPTKARDF